MKTRIAVVSASVVLAVISASAQDQRFYRVVATTDSVITAFSPQSMLLTWSNAAVGGNAMVQMNEDLLTTNWVSYIHTRRIVAGTVEAANVDHPAQVPRTGQSGVENQGDDGTYQKGLPWPAPRFTIQADTNAVLDNLTGLMWTRNANLAGMLTWSNALTFCETLDHAGFADWRLPNVRELLSLIDFAQDDPALPAGFPFSAVQGFYWSSTTYAYDQDSAWTVEPSVGLPRTRGKSNTWYVWAVRGETDMNKTTFPAPVPRTGQTNSYQQGDDGFYRKGIPWPEPRFTAGSGVSSNSVRDNLTGLMWLRNPDHVVRTITAAISYCEQLDGSEGRGNRTDWRLPNVLELLSLIDFSQRHGLPAGHPFIDADWGIRLSGTRYEPAHASGWSVNIENGTFEIRGAGNDGYVWPVCAGR